MPANLPFNFPDFSRKLFDIHEQIKEKKLNKRRFKHKDIVRLIEQLPFFVRKIGNSFENRAIYQIKIGSGKTKVLLWSQMHGDEATATMALFDIFNFFQSDDDLQTFKTKIFESCTLYFVPMLNPDGAERFQRRTATDIDMNRDALRLQTPEGVLLKQLQEELKPDFSFNLHDQDTKYAAGRSPKQATVSFLATSYNFSQNWNVARTQAMQVICEMNEALQKFIPDQVGKWNDPHEPRAFGDNIALWGSSLILIESGGYQNDIEKQFIRKLNFVAILEGLQSISQKSYQKYTLSSYEKIPNNERSLFDLLIRNAEFMQNDKMIIKDIGINLSEKNIDNATDFVFESVIEDLGDLSTFWGIEEIDAQGLKVSSFSDFPQIIEKYTLSEDAIKQEFNRNTTANFLLTEGKEIRYIILNGQIR